MVFICSPLIRCSGLEVLVEVIIFGCTEEVEIQGVWVDMEGFAVLPFFYGNAVECQVCSSEWFGEEGFGNVFTDVINGGLVGEDSHADAIHGRQSEMLEHFELTHGGHVIATECISESGDEFIVDLQLVFCKEDDGLIFIVDNLIWTQIRRSSSDFDEEIDPWELSMVIVGDFYWGVTIESGFLMNDGAFAWW